MLDNRSAKIAAKSQTRQQAWLDALKKPNFFARHFKCAMCLLFSVGGFLYLNRKIAQFSVFLPQDDQ